MKLTSKKKLCRWELVLLLVFYWANGNAVEGLSLKMAEQIALDDEPGILGLDARTRSLLENSVAEGELKDPKLQVGLLNLPTDSFEFDQENMTQFKVSYIQEFPSGDSRDIKREKAISQSRGFKHQSEDRKRQVLTQVRLAYLETLYWEQARETVTQNRQLVSQLSEFVESQFSVGRTNQFDFITVQQRISKLDDRLTQIDQNISAERYRLSEWIGEELSQMPLVGEYSGLGARLQKHLDSDLIDQTIAGHPRIKEINNQIDVGRKNLKLARESEKPGWALNVSYAYRDDAPDGTERADFVSATVTLDLPLFGDNRQQKRQNAQQYDIQASQSQRDALLRKMRSDVLRIITNLDLLGQRDTLFSETLIPQATQRSEAALHTYQSGGGSFADVMQAYLDALNLQLEQKRIQIDKLKTRARLLYYLQASADA